MRVRCNRAIAVMLAMLLAIGGFPGLAAPGGGKANAAGTVQVWQEVGGAGFSGGYASSVTMSVYEGVPYVAFRNQDDKATVMKYDGEDWTTLGSAGFSASYANDISMSIYQGVPYVAYSDVGNANKTTVMKYTGAGATGWEPVGSPGLSEGLAHYPSVYVYDGTPYVAYKDWQSDGKVTVMKYTEAGATGWEAVGGAGFSTTRADEPILHIDEETLYVAYMEVSNDNKAAVMKYDEGSGAWVTVGSAGFSEGEAYLPSLYVYEGTPYLAYQDEVNGNKLTVMKYTGAGTTGWEALGHAGFTAGRAAIPSLYVYQGTPYVAFQDYWNQMKATVMKYTGAGASGWELVGDAGMSAGEVAYPSLYVYDGIPYVAYQDVENSFKATMMRINTFNAPPSLSVNRNADGQIEIAFSDDAAWRDAITAIKEGTELLPEGTDYIIEPGKMTITKELSDGKHTIVIEADGYADATVVFAISDDFDGGMGTASNPFRIATADQLDAVRNYLERGLYFELIADIDLSGYPDDEGWKPIFPKPGQPMFQGNMDGNGYIITGLTINAPESFGVGLFGGIDNGSIANMRLEGVNITGDQYAGGLVGYNANGTISDSYVTGVVSGTNIVGGLAGINIGTIKSSYADVDVTGNFEVGGLAGVNVGMIDNSYAEGAVTGAINVGGLAGSIVGMIESSYAIGAVTGDERVGGLIGVNEGRIRSSFYDTETTGQSDTGKGEGKSTSEMKTLSTYSGWDYDEAWGMDESIHTGYPYLQWTTRTAQYDSNGGSAVGNQVVIYKGNATKPADPARSGYTFGGWYTDSGFAAPFDFTTPITSDLTLYAKWTAIYTGGGGPVTSKNGKLTLLAGQAGEVGLDDAITITVPAGAAPQALIITIEKLADTQQLLARKEILVSSVYEVLKNIPAKFSKPATLTMAFDSSMLSGNQSVAIFYYDETAQAWVKVSGGQIKGNRISAPVDHFTKFAVLAVDSATGELITEKPAEEQELADISGHWAEAAIKEAVREGVVKGYEDGTFKPDAAVTRAQFAVMLMNALKPAGGGAELHFTDAIPAWARPSIAQAVEAGIVRGYDDGSFRPGASITRSELAVMIARAAGADSKAAGSTGFLDDSLIPDWAKEAVAAVKEMGIVSGRSGNLFAPSDTATRAEAVTIIMNLLRAIELKEKTTE
ncbi:S-layer homology domain-containing protein [Paenibacillus sp. LHD-117]|uniref:S-layer homology domain-containing protein n=1 Tax=Paenibacillus sp. LHD-117 TaxID=3071412 RepID=UPI0027DEAD1F|nr:S-layer homology domain-containing protein [Paenibacillus sp. LHD-117]MDQ6422012.1 S-layer homology domain-containing protein [Paenibacillus sp. LHD-117]